MLKCLKNIFETLDFIRVGPSINKNWIKILYIWTKSCVSQNGLTSDHNFQRNWDFSDFNKKE